MIRLTSAQDGTTVYIAPENITFITKSRMLFGEIETTITASDGMLYVTESPEEVARKVLGWRLAMERYRAYTYSAACEDTPQANEIWPLAHNVESKLMRLAGLEEPNNDAR